MMLRTPTRGAVSPAATVALWTGLFCFGSVVPVAQAQQAPAPIERRPPAIHSGAPSAVNGGHHGPRGEHLAEWMNQHSALSPQQQQQALEREPGFHDLPHDTQQRMRNRLAQLDSMSPEQRQRHLAHIEAMERLTPDQRAEVRGAMSQLGSLPPDDRHTVARTFRALRELPPEQRISAYSSGQVGQQLSEGDRAVLFNLLRVEPMLEPATPAQTPYQSPR